MTGRYVAFEGIEGAGKSTVAARIARMLEDRGERVTLVREPGGTATAERIRTILLDTEVPIAPWTEALLFSAARAQLTHEVVAPALLRGEWVLSDRTVYSSLAYQGRGRGLGIAAVRAVNEPGLAAWPDLVVLLRIDAATGIRRQRDPDRIGREGAGFLEQAAAGFEELALAEPERFLVVEADQNVDRVVGEVWKAVTERWMTSSTG